MTSTVKTFLLHAFYNRALIFSAVYIALSSITWIKIKFIRKKKKRFWIKVLFYFRGMPHIDNVKNAAHKMEKKSNQVEENNHWKHSLNILHKMCLWYIFFHLLRKSLLAIESLPLIYNSCIICLENQFNPIPLQPIKSSFYLMILNNLFRLVSSVGIPFSLT